MGGAKSRDKPGAVSGVMELDLIVQLRLADEREGGRGQGRVADSDTNASLMHEGREMEKEAGGGDAPYLTSTCSVSYMRTTWRNFSRTATLLDSSSCAHLVQADLCVFALAGTSLPDGLGLQPRWQLPEELSSPTFSWLRDTAWSHP